MDKELYQNLINFISSYYPIIDSESNELRKIVSEKINQLEDPTPFKLLCKDFEAIGQVEDCSYLQFPTRKFYLEKIEDIGMYRVFKNFAVCISLLCPYYTFFYEFQFKIKTADGFVGLSQMCFLKDKKFDFIRDEFDLKKIDSLIKAQFPEYSYIDHYILLANEINRGLPFGEFESEKKEFSFFRYLFDNINFDRYF
jgi:hypothetical protein